MTKLRQILPELVSGRGTARRVVEGAALQAPPARRAPPSALRAATSPRQARRGSKKANLSNPVSPDLIRGKAGLLWTNQNMREAA